MPNVVAMIDQKIATLEFKRGDWTAAGLTCFLYVNAHTPTAYDTLSDYSPTAVEGVIGLPVNFPSPSADNGDGTAIMRGDFLVFQPTGTSIVEDVVGWFVVRNDTGVPVLAQEYDDPVVGFGATLEGLVVVPQAIEGDL